MEETTVWMIARPDEAVFVRDLWAVSASGAAVGARRLAVRGEAVLDREGRPVEEAWIVEGARRAARGEIVRLRRCPACGSPLEEAP